MKRLAFILLLSSAFLLAGGCGESTCEKICANCADWSDDCKADCKEQYREGDEDCREAMRDFAGCVDDKGCDSLSCVAKAADVSLNCY